MSSTSGQFLTIHHNGETDQTTTLLDLPSITSSSPTAEIEFNTTDKLEYLSQLLKDKRQLSAAPNMFIHIDRLLDQEINKVRFNLFNSNSNPKIVLPEPNGEKKIFQEKIFIPVQEYPEFNFVGRILGPRGMTAKQLEIDTGCKIMVRGRGSMRDKQKEDQNRGKPNWEHLNEELHVLIQCEDYENRALVKLERAKEEISKLLKPTAEGEDYLKKKQLTELAIINGTYREPNLFSKKFPFQNNQIPIGAPLILTPRIQQNFLTTSMPPTTTPTFFTTTETQPTTISTVPQSSLLQNGESNFLQVFTPLQTIDSIGGMLTSGTHLFEYPSQTAFPFLTTTTATGIKYIFTITFVKQHHALAVIVVLDIIKAKVLIYSLTVC
ncbi:unnamed protein product [Rotaria sp. Silwood1]|nr:unnamed protein product [Rotaria sp. Silwood1]CAF1137179.1 unnamed protein product [Rotaria sp. Silwood1]